MKVFHPLLALTSIVICNVALADPLSDCKDTSGNAPLYGNRRIASFSQSSHGILSIENDKFNGKDQDIEKGELIFSADIKYTENVTTLTPSSDISIKSSWWTTPGVNISASQGAIVSDVQLSDGSSYFAIEYGTRAFALITKDGKICNTLYLKNPERSGGFDNYPGTTSVTPVEFTLTEGKKEALKINRPMSVRIAYNGITDGMLSIQYVWVSNSRVVKSYAKKFDPLSTTLPLIPGVEFKIAEAKPGRIKLRYENSTPTEVDKDNAAFIRGLSKL